MLILIPMAFAPCCQNLLLHSNETDLMHACLWFLTLCLACNRGGCALRFSLVVSGSLTGTRTGKKERSKVQSDSSVSLSLSNVISEVTSKIILQTVIFLEREFTARHFRNCTLVTLWRLTLRSVVLHNLDLLIMGFFFLFEEKKFILPTKIKNK